LQVLFGKKYFTAQSGCKGAERFKARLSVRRKQLDSLAATHSKQRPECVGTLSCGTYFAQQAGRIFDSQGALRRIPGENGPALPARPRK
jgi:hypothetical protein